MCVFLTVGKMSFWNVKGSHSERDNEDNFKKPAAKRKKIFKKLFMKRTTKHLLQLERSFYTNCKAGSGVRGLISSC